MYLKSKEKGKNKTGIPFWKALFPSASDGQGSQFSKHDWTAALWSILLYVTCKPHNSSTNVFVFFCNDKIFKHKSTKFNLWERISLTCQWKC